MHRGATGAVVIVEFEFMVEMNLTDRNQRVLPPTHSSRCKRKAPAVSPVQQSEIGGDAIKVQRLNSCIAPETILTERNLERIPKEQLASLLDTHPLKRLGTPEDVACAAVFRASGEAGWITGVVLDVAGGAVMLR
jgi:hypothetical protein